MHMRSVGRWVVRLSVVAVLGLAVLAAASWYTPNDTVWTAKLLPAVSVGR
jgi:hypothetical protein